MNQPILCVTDLHGCGSEFQALINPFLKTHKIYALGDLFDRSFEGLKVWETINQCGVCCLAGNHDLKLLAYITGKREHIPKHYVYFLNEFSKKYNLEDLVTFLKNLPLTIKLDDQHLAVHAAIDIYNPFREDKDINAYGRLANTVRWYHLYKKIAPVIVYGHEVWRNKGVRFGYSKLGHINSIGLDTGAAHGQRLTGLEIVDGKYKFHEVPSKDYYIKMKSLNIEPNYTVLNFRANEIRKTC